MGRKILLVTTDQQRYDTLGCNGGTVARTPVADRLAAEGVRYERAYNQNTVCMPARSTMLRFVLNTSNGSFFSSAARSSIAVSVSAHACGCVAGHGGSTGLLEDDEVGGRM